MKDLKRLIRLIFGLYLCGLGTYLAVRANIGLSPWDAFAAGLSLRTGMLFGDAMVLSGFMVLAVDLLMREPIGLGTILNTMLIGKFADLMAWLSPVPYMESLLAGVPVLLLGQILICIGSYYYISTGWGCGPRDSLMVGIGKRLPRIPIGLARFCTEGIALTIGWSLGAPVGLGTVISIFGISFTLQTVFHLYRFDAKSVKHEHLLGTIRRWTGK